MLMPVQVKCMVVQQWWGRRTGGRLENPHPRLCNCKACPDITYCWPDGIKCEEHMLTTNCEWGDSSLYVLNPSGELAVAGSGSPASDPATSSDH